VKRGNRKPPPEWIVRVRWTRDHWLELHGSARWNLRLFQSAPHAASFALRLAESGARVEWTAWAVDPSRVAGPREDLEPLADWLDRHPSAATEREEFFRGDPNAGPRRRSSRPLSRPDFPRKVSPE